MKIAVVGPSEERDALFYMLEEACRMQRLDAQCSRFSELPELMAAGEVWQIVLLYTVSEYYELTCEFRRQQPDCTLILWSESDSLCRKSFALHPQDYLVCPIGQEALRKALYRCRESLLPSLPYIVCTGPQKGRRLRFVEVRYMESFGHTCVLHCAEEEISFGRSLRSMGEEAGSLFVRCHRSYLVNLYWIDSIEEDAVVLRSGERVPVGEKQYEALLQLWTAFREKCRALTGL